MKSHIVTTSEQYEAVCTRTLGEEYILTPFFRDERLHPSVNGLLCVTLSFFTGESYTISVSHDDAPMFPCPPLQNARVTGRRFTSTHTKSCDTLFYVTRTPIPSLKEYYMPMMAETLHTFWKYKNVFRLIPLSILAQVSEAYNKRVLSHIEEKLNSDLATQIIQSFDVNLNTLSEIEENGLAIDVEVFKQHFPPSSTPIVDGKIYTCYNPFTLTSRPSNRFNGINFSALNKHDGSRDAFISRYPSGKLIQFDFDAYHIRLVADMLGIELPSGSFHMEMAKLYFGQEEISPEMYANSKQLTFEIMYGLTPESYGIELFSQIHALRNSYKNNTLLTLANGIELDAHTLSENKQFNYFVQSLEAYKTIPKLQKILNIVKNTNNHIVLYTYDSILLDMETLDTTIISCVKNILEENGKFPVKMHIGTSYGNLGEYT